MRIETPYAVVDLDFEENEFLLCNSHKEDIQNLNIVSNKRFMFRDDETQEFIFISLDEMKALRQVVNDWINETEQRIEDAQAEYEQLHGEKSEFELLNKT